MKRLIACLLLYVAAGLALGAAPPPPSASPTSVSRPAPAKAERGWFFFDDPAPAAPPEAAASAVAARPLPREMPPLPKDESCKKKDTWEADCGFVHPGTDFAFQAKQRDALMERMAVSPNDPRAVENFQYYMRWALERTAEVTNIWQYNMTQNPDLDPRVAQPINALGLRLMTDVRRGQEAEFTRLMAEEGVFLIYFSRQDCHFCHAMAPLVRELGKQMGLSVRNAALDASCIKGLEEHCVVAPRTTVPAQVLQVSVVPTVFLYVPARTFIRIATGVTDVATMKARALQYFQATRTALLKGVDNGTAPHRPGVDFSDIDAAASGATQVPAAPAPARLPTEAEVARLLGARP